jgi:hypothetical protein
MLVGQNATLRGVDASTSHRSVCCCRVRCAHDNDYDFGHVATMQRCLQQGCDTGDIIEALVTQARPRPGTADKERCL